MRGKSKKTKRVRGRRDAPVAGGPKASYLGLGWPALAPLALMLLAILLVVIARIRLLGIPLERDEGEYAYIGQLMLQGVAPYAEAANMKLPGTNAAYALIMAVFGQSISAIRIGLLLANAGCAVLVYFVARRLFGPVAGFAAAAAYAVLSVSPSVMGVWAHATHFVVLAALGALLLLLQWVESRKVHTLFWSGLLFGMAFLMKQPGILFAVFGALYLAYSQLVSGRRQGLRSGLWQAAQSLLLFAGAVALPCGVTCALLWRAGVFARFWLWVFTYAARYVSLRPVSTGLIAFRSAIWPILSINLGIGLLAAAGLLALWAARRNRAAAVFVTGLLVCSFLAVCPGLYFREHYFILVLPAAALSIGAIATAANGTVAESLPLWLIAGSLLFAVGQQSALLFQMSPLEVTRSVYGRNPFPEAIPVAEYIRSHSNKDDRIAVLGSEPEIYFYARRRSVTPYVYIYPLVEAQPLAPQMQAEFIHDVETRRPEYLVVVDIAASWLRQPNSPSRLLEWATPYCRLHYDRVGVVDIFQEGSIFRWDAAAVGYWPRSSHYLEVFRRRGNGT